MCKILEIMKALRYLLIVVAILSVLGVSAQTPQYGKSYKGQETQFVYTTAQMPAATMESVDAGFMQSGSSLPMAAQSGVTTTYDRNNAPSRPRREGDWEDDEWGETGDPWATPIGDVMWPMMMLALAYAIYKVSRMRRREKSM